MKRTDFLRIVGAGDGAEYAPVAGLLKTGYGFAGYFNSRLNEGLDDTCIVVNVRLVFLCASDDGSARPRLSDFNEFVEEIVRRSYQSDKAPQALRRDEYGKSIPLAAIPYDEMAVIYPVAHIGTMLETLREGRKKVPSFLDLDKKSEILKVLRTKLW